MMHVIVNWGGKIGYNLDRIYNLTQMMRSNGYEVSLVEKDSNRQRWLLEHLGENVIIKNAQRGKSGHCAG
ncbi:MAG TPA: hypothetical protein VN426_06700 [Syntrophomonadaceae bacterium]|nr:hypothetical protein [Syntrophomonadaceae bacterium]